MNRVLRRPSPVIDEREHDLLNNLTEKYNQMIKPSPIAKIGSKAVVLIPANIKGGLKDLGGQISRQELVKKVIAVVEPGFTELQAQATKITISRKQILNLLNKYSTEHKPNDIDEICLLRSYDISKAVNAYRTSDILAAAVEGAATGAFGFAGLPFNLALSLFLYFRAVQEIALFYGYNVKEDNAEMVIAGDVFIKAMSPSDDESGDEGSILIGKIMAMSEATIVKETAKKSWSDMVAKGGVPLLLAQIRALANKAAAKALKDAGQKGLERNVFRHALTLLGKRMSLKAIGKAVPVVSAVVGALLDTTQMCKVLEFADVFYHKRFLLEKAERERVLFGEDASRFNQQMVDVEYQECD